MKLVMGVGVNDLPRGSCSAIVNGRPAMHTFYNKWKDMLRRCYDQNLHKNKPLTEDVLFVMSGRP